MEIQEGFIKLPVHKYQVFILLVFFRCNSPGASPVLSIVPSDKWKFTCFINVMDSEARGMIFPGLNKKVAYQIVTIIR